MLRNITIRQKMLFFILGITVVVYITSLSYVLLSLRAKAIDEAQKLADSFALQKATDSKAVFDEDMAVARNMAAIVKEYTLKPKALRNELRKDLMVNILEQYPKYDATWMSWQLWALDSTWTKDYGRERTNFYTRDGKINSSQELANLDGDPTGGVYKYLKDNPHKKEKLSEPYWYLDYNYESGSRDSLLGISPTVVIEVDGRFAGVIGSDMTVDDFAGMSDIDFYEDGFAFLLSNEGVIISHKRKELFSQSMNELSIVRNSPFDVASKIKNGESFSYSIFDEDSGEDVYVSFAPIQIGRTDSPWSAGTIVPIAEITAPFNSTLYLTMLVGIIGLLIVTIVIWRVATPITNSLEDTNEILKEIAQGKLQTDHHLNTVGEDELAQIGRSMELLVDELNTKAEFSREIGGGNLEVELDVAGDDDVLGNSLLMMRDNLRSVIEETNDVIREAGEEGKLKVRISSEGKTGVWSDLSVSMNHLLSSFSTPLVSLNRIINGMATGDLTLRYQEEAKGDIANMAENLNQALDNIDGLLHQINSSVTVVDDSSSEMSVASEEMNTNTTEIASAVAQMSNGAQAQVAKVDESSNLIEGILKSSNEMGRTAENINGSAKVVAESSQKGMEMVGDVVSSMGEISDFSSRTNESIQVLTDRSKEIARVLGVITDIASQTNLLALNAAIEAAQAGDAGRGFAVVAEEIRKLAEDSRKSAQEIEKLVTDVQTDTLKAARVISEMNTRVQSGEETSKAAAVAFEEIYKSSSENLNYSEEILNGAKVQIDDINNVVTIMESVVVIAEQTAAGTEEMASSASELSAGMASYNLKTQKLADIADELKEGLSMVKLSGTATENTAIFRMKEAFEKEKALLDALLNNMPDTIYFKDRESKFIRNSKSHSDQFGLKDPEEMVGMSDFDFFGEHAQKSFDKEKEIMDTRTPMINVVEANDMKDGTVRYTSTTKLPLIDLEGNVVGTFGISRDVTDTKDAEVRAVEQAKAFEKEKSLLDALLTNMPDAIYFKDLESKFIRCSQSVAEVVGMKSADDMIGKSDFDFRPKEQAQEWYEDEQEMMRTGKVIKNEVSKNVLHDGTYTYVSNTKLPLKDNSGTTIGLVGISRDITETYQQVEELDKLKIENKKLKTKLK